MATVTVKVKHDDGVKTFNDAEATEEGGSVVVKKGGKVVGRFDVNKVEHWSASDDKRK
jgi:hypothetical protein